MKTGLILGVTVLFIVLVALLSNREAFTSPGTMVQLATSHVPTAEDVYYFKKVYPNVVRKDLIDMTGGDPGPVSAAGLQGVYFL